MDGKKLFEAAAEFLRTSPLNTVSEEDAISPELIGMRIYGEPLFSAASADDAIFEMMRRDGIISREYMPPREWLDGAKSVLSFFLPFDERVVCANGRDIRTSSPEWLHARIEGQQMIEALGAYICGLLGDAGFEAVFPAKDKRFKFITPYISNWSERHAAYACGLGTFGLSRGLITKKGMAGRFGSVVTTAELSATERTYSEPFEYCIMCGKCAQRCPVGAIDISRGIINGKDQVVCGNYVEASKSRGGRSEKLRYGCGKCQTRVPCESGIPLSE